MTFLELCQAYRSELGIPGNGPNTVVNQIGELQRVVLDIQDADQDIKRQWQDWKFLWKEFTTNTVVGESYLQTVKPSDLGHWDLNSFWINKGTANAVKLNSIDYREWRSAQTAYAPESGDPYEFTIRPTDEARVNPIPTSVVPVSAEYYKKAARMSNDSDVSDVPEEYHRIIIVRAKLIYAEREDAPEIMSGASAEYDSLITNLEASYLPASKDGRQGSVQQPRSVRAV